VLHLRLADWPDNATDINVTENIRRNIFFLKVRLQEALKSYFAADCAQELGKRPEDMETVCCLLGKVRGQGHGGD